jgi:septin family protein
LFEFASQKLKVAPSALMLEQLDASLISSFLEYLESTTQAVVFEEFRQVEGAKNSTHK